MCISSVPWDCSELPPKVHLILDLQQFNLDFFCGRRGFKTGFLVVQAGLSLAVYLSNVLELLILCLTPQSWDYKHVLLHLASI